MWPTVAPETVHTSRAFIQDSLHIYIVRCHDEIVNEKEQLEC